MRRGCDVRFAAAVVCALLAGSAVAETAAYGAVDLTGLARESWPLNSQFKTHNAMVCNVNGPDGYLSIRSGPGSDFKAVRKLKRLAILQVDVSKRRGRWVRVLGAYRETTPEGRA